MRVSFIGLKTWEQAVAVDGLQGEALQIVLEPESTEIGTVVVTAQPPALKKELGKFVMDGVYRSPLAKGVNAQLFLRTVPILNTSRDGSVGILNKSLPRFKSTVVRRICR